MELKQHTQFTKEQLMIIDYTWLKTQCGYYMNWWNRLKVWLHRQAIDYHRMDTNIIPIWNDQSQIIDLKETK